MRVSRAQVIQSILDFFPFPDYLEIGVARGATFHELKAGTKIAVDPRFKFDVDEAQAANPNASYNQVTSDAFFAGCPITQKFDVVYIDGLHTFEQTLRDLMNTLSHVKKESIIIIDDIFPVSIAAAVPDIRDFRKIRRFIGQEGRGWMGDVYKLVLFVDTFMQSWLFRCVENNHGQLIMWQAPREQVHERLVSYVGLAGYDRAILERDHFRFRPLEQIVAEIRLSRSGEGSIFPSSG